MEREAELPNTGVRVPSHNLEDCRRKLSENSRENLLAKIGDGVDVRFPIHGAREHDPGRIRGRWGSDFILLRINPGRDDGDGAVRIHRQHLLAIVFGDGNHVMELAQCVALVTPHFPSFEAIGKALRRICFRRCHTLPQGGLYVVLEKHRRRGEILREVQRRGKKIANRYVELFFIEPSGHGRLHGSVREFTYGKGRRLEQAAQVMQRLRDGASIRGCCVDGLCPGQFALDFRFVGRVALPAVIGEQGYFVIAGKMAENVIGTDLASGVDWQQLARFDPQNSQSFSSHSNEPFRCKAPPFEKRPKSNTNLDALRGLGSVH